MRMADRQERGQPQTDAGKIPAGEAPFVEDVHLIEQLRHPRRAREGDFPGQKRLRLEEIAELVVDRRGEIAKRDGGFLSSTVISVEAIQALPASEVRAHARAIAQARRRLVSDVAPSTGCDAAIRFAGRISRSSSCRLLRTNHARGRIRNSSKGKVVSRLVKKIHARRPTLVSEAVRTLATSAGIVKQMPATRATT